MARIVAFSDAIHVLVTSWASLVVQEGMPELLYVNTDIGAVWQNYAVFIVEAPEVGLDLGTCRNLFLWVYTS
ncbi:hypothetical protein CHS0354_013092, partial [Potamilus streckersoni]